MTDAVMNARQLRRDLARLDSLAAPATISQWREQQFWFDNLIKNGTFDTATTNWSDNNGAILSIDSARLKIENGSAAFGRAWQEIKTDILRHYRATVTYAFGDAASGVDIQAREDTVSGTAIATSGAQPVEGPFSLDFTPRTEATVIRLGNASATLAKFSFFDNAHVYETDGTDIIHRLPEGWEPADVFVDGLLIREGATHDYTVETDGFDKWIKPAVAPGALTETCIMGVRKV